LSYSRHESQDHIGLGSIAASPGFWNHRIKRGIKAESRKNSVKNPTLKLIFLTDPFGIVVFPQLLWFFLPRGISAACHFLLRFWWGKNEE
jgi:hypothetical protein